MAFIYVVYLDQLMLENEWMNLVTLSLIWMLTKKMTSYIRVMIASVLGTVTATIVFFCIHNYPIYVALEMFFVIPLMVHLAFEKSILKQVTWCYVIYIIFAGVMKFLLNVFLEEKEKLFVMLISFILTTLITLWIAKKRKQEQKFARVVLVGNEKQKLEILALCDSGNVLKDPYYHLPVSIVSQKVVEQMISNKEVCLLIPAVTVSKERTLLKGYRILQMDVEGYGMVKPCIIASAKEEIFINKKYQMILHSDYCT